MRRKRRVPASESSATTCVRIIVNDLNAGRSHVDDLTDTDIVEMQAAGFMATADPACMVTADAIVICVPTPLKDDTTPDLRAIEAATAEIGTRLSSGTLVVLESTTYPGTTNDVVRPILEEHSGLLAGVDFHLAFSPERIDPGNPEFGLRNTPKVVGGDTEIDTKVAVALYERIVDEVVPTVGTREAEMAKLREHLSPRQHCLDERDGDLRRRARHRPVVGD